jgi:dTDP-4-dehydrorhamnose reductase
MAKILVTGASGQLGRELQELARVFPGHAPGLPKQARDLRFIFADRTQLTIDDPEGVQAFFAAANPDWCINCAAYTAVDKAEADAVAAFRINGDAVGFIAAASRDTGTRLIHLSTDYVFDGSSPAPLTEKDPTGPVSVYGASKLAGEQQALDRYPDGTLIIRTSWVYSEFGHNFVRTMIRLMNERPSINVVDDQIGSPTYAADLAAAILHIINGGKFVPGIYNYSNEGRISWYEFALEIRRLTGSQCTVNPITTAQYPTPARRPRFSLLEKRLIRETFGVEIPRWEESLAICIARINAAAQPPTIH